MFKEEPFKIEHLNKMELRRHEREVLTRQFILNVCMNTTSWAVLAGDGSVVAIFGYTFLWDGVMEVFIYPSTLVPHYAKTFVNYTRTVIKMLHNTLPVRRMQSTAWDEHQTNNWMKRIGFVCEGTMRAYTKHGHDYKMWSIVRGKDNAGIWRPTITA